MFVSSPACLHLHVVYHSSRLPSSFPPPVELYRAPWKPCFPIFCHICICSSFCLECLLYFPALSNDSCLPPPRPLLFSTRIVGKVIYFFKTYFTWRFLYDNFLQNFPWNATKFANFYLCEIPDPLCWNDVLTYVSYYLSYVLESDTCHMINNCVLN